MEEFKLEINSVNKKVPSGGVMSQKPTSFNTNNSQETMHDDIEEEKVIVTDMNRVEEDRMSRISPPNQVNGERSPSRSMVSGNKPIVGKRGRKTDREREEIGGRREWTDTEISVLISLWRDNDILYDTNHPLYYVQSERKLVMDYISKEMNIGVRDVNDKMHSLRTYYCSQRQRTEALDAKGGNSRAFPRWKFYDQMSFLYESVTNRAAKSSLSSTRRGRKTRLDSKQASPDQIQAVPYTMMHIGPRADYSPTGSQVDLRRSLSTERAYYNDEKYELHNVQQRRAIQTTTPTNYHTEINSPSSTESNPRKRHFSEEAWPDLQQCKDQNTGGAGAFKTIEVPLNTADEIFGHMVACSLAKVKDEQEKELLKLEIQKLIYKTRFKTENGQQ